MFDAVELEAFDIKANEDAFANGLGNGKGSLRAVAYCMHNMMVTSNGGYDGTSLARMIDRAHARGHTTGANAVAKLVKAVFGDKVKVQHPKEGKTARVAMRGAVFNSDAWEVLCSLVAENRNLFDARVSRAFAKSKDYDIAALKRAVLKAKAEGNSDDVIMDIVRETLAGVE